MVPRPAIFVAPAKSGKKRRQNRNTGDKVEDLTLQIRTAKDVSSPTSRTLPWFSSSIRAPTRPAAPSNPAAFADAFKKFQKEGIVVLGISRDTVKGPEEVQDKYDLPYDLLADPDMVLINRYDLIKPKNMCGKLVKGVKRTTYLIGPDTGKGQQLIHTPSKRSNRKDTPKRFWPCSKSR